MFQTVQSDTQCCKWLLIRLGYLLTPLFIVTWSAADTLIQGRRPGVAVVTDNSQEWFWQHVGVFSMTLSRFQTTRPGRPQWSTLTDGPGTGIPCPH